MKRTVVFLLLVAALAACGGDGNGDAGDSQTGGTGQASDLQGKLLTISDVPTGYVVTEGESDEIASEFCDGKFDVAGRYPPEDQAEVQFQKAGTQPLTGNVLLELLAEYSTEGAEQAFDGVAAAVQECATFEQTDAEDGTTLTGQIQPMSSFPGLGDETLAIKVTGQATVQDTAIPVTLEAVFVRQGGTIIAVANGGLGSAPVDPQVTEALTEVAYQKAF